MTTLRDHAEQYLAVRRKLGFKLTTWGQKLMSFIGYLEQSGATVVTTDAAVAWATGTRRSTSQIHWSRRLMVVRIFARHLKTLEPSTEIPAEDVLSHHYCRVTPHLYQPAEIAALLAAAGTLTPQLRGLTYQTLISVLAVTGLRSGEHAGWTVTTSTSAPGCCPSETPSSANRVRFRYTTAPLRH